MLLKQNYYPLIFKDYYHASTLLFESFEDKVILVTFTGDFRSRSILYRKEPRLPQFPRGRSCSRAQCGPPLLSTTHRLARPPCGSRMISTPVSQTRRAQGRGGRSEFKSNATHPGASAGVGGRDTTLSPGAVLAMAPEGTPLPGTTGDRDQAPVPQWARESDTWTTACLSVCSLCPPTTPTVDGREGQVPATGQS